MPLYRKNSGVFPKRLDPGGKELQMFQSGKTHLVSAFQPIRQDPRDIIRKPKFDGMNESIMKMTANEISNGLNCLINTIENHYIQKKQFFVKGLQNVNKFGRQYDASHKQSFKLDAARKVSGLR